MMEQHHKKQRCFSAVHLALVTIHLDHGLIMLNGKASARVPKQLALGGL